MSDVMVCRVDALPVGAMVRVEGPNEGIAVYNVAGAYFATSDSCTHADARLTEGTLTDDVVECPYHGGSFCVRDGQARNFPAYVPLTSYPVRVEGDDIVVSA
jgi:nitrite reductase/ring-hydroxylating ferredoxin subunit